MYLYCYARSNKGKETGSKLLSKVEGEWINSIEDFAQNNESLSRADGAIVMIIPLAAAVKLLMDNIYKSKIKCPVFMIDSDSRFAGILRREGYNDYDMLTRICDITGAKVLTKESDRQEFAPDLRELVKRYNMVADKPELLEKISDYVSAGGNINVYSDMPLKMIEPTLDSLSYSTFTFRESQKKELCQAYVAAAEGDYPSVFITYTVLPEMDAPNVVILTPRLVVLGLELTPKTDAGYAYDTVVKTLTKHSINPKAVSTISVSSMVMNTEAVNSIADKLQCNKLAYDTRMLKTVRLPLKATYSQVKNEADTCTAAAYLASENGRILIRRGGDKSILTLTAAAFKEDIELTK